MNGLFPPTCILASWQQALVLRFIIYRVTVMQYHSVEEAAF